MRVEIEWHDWNSNSIQKKTIVKAFSVRIYRGNLEVHYSKTTGATMHADSWKISAASVTRMQTYKEVEEIESGA